MNESMLEVSREDLKELKRLYKEVATEVFVFKGRKILKQYAKYMIEYLERKL